MNQDNKKVKTEEEDGNDPSIRLTKGLSSGDLHEYCKFFDNSGLEELVLESKDYKLQLSAKSAAHDLKSASIAVSPVVNIPSTVPALPPEAVEPPATKKPDTDTRAVVSPIVGTFYAKPNPESPNFVKVGDTIVRGQVIGIVEAMKIMNEIESTEEGQISEILVKNGDLVSEGQKILLLR